MTKNAAILHMAAEVNGSMLRPDFAHDVYLAGWQIILAEFADYYPWQRLANGTWTGALNHLRAGAVDTLKYTATLNVERIAAFEFFLVNAANM